MRTANPALNAKTFQGTRSYNRSNAMTIQGTVNKTGVMLFLLVMTAAWTWANFATMSGLIIVGAIGGFVVAIVTVFKKEWAGITAPIYALLEGLVVGGISAFFEMKFPGIVIQAVTLTFGTLFCLLAAYKSGAIKVTENFKLGIVAATGAIALIYIVGMVMGFFGARIPYIHESGPIGIGFSLVVVVIAALNLVLDFDFIEKGAEAGAPKYMEWYGAFGLMVTLIWLYLEILRLLSKIYGRRR
ncbi:Bax inhibitor-1/YccA family protein [Thermoproteota archaeon]